MRIAPRILLSLVLLGVLALVVALLQPRLGGFSAWFYVASAAFALTRREVVHARDDEPGRAPDTVLGLCGVGIGAWLLIGLWLAAPRIGAVGDRWVGWWLGLATFACLNPFTLSFAMLYAVAFGIVGMRKAASATTACLVALAHFSAPAAYVTLLILDPI